MSGIKGKTGIYKRTKPNPFKGRHHTDDAKKKMSFDRSGEKNAGYIDGRSLKEDYVKIKNKNWINKNRSHKNFLNGRRRIMKLQALGSHTESEWETLKAQYNWTCPACHKAEPQIVLSEDHIIPLLKGGSDNIENIQPLCRSCNSRKHTKIIKFTC